MASINLDQEGPKRITPIASFKNCGLHPAMAKNVELAGYRVPTPIQKYTIPAILEGFDVIGIAQTGKSGRVEICFEKVRQQWLTESIDI